MAAGAQRQPQETDRNSESLLRSLMALYGPDLSGLGTEEGHFQEHISDVHLLLTPLRQADWEDQIRVLLEGPGPKKGVGGRLPWGRGGVQTGGWVKLEQKEAGREGVSLKEATSK